MVAIKAPPHFVNEYDIDIAAVAFWAVFHFSLDFHFVLPFFIFWLISQSITFIVYFFSMWIKLTFIKKHTKKNMNYILLSRQTPCSSTYCEVGVYYALIS